MKKILTNNIGLKISSLLVSIILWMIVVNVDDPIITRVYSGIPVEIINASAITSQGKTFEVAEGNDSISVAVTAERSIIENLTKDNIKATADMKNLNAMNAIPIELRSTRYSEKISSLTTRSSNLHLIIEDKKDKQIKLTITSTGDVAQGYLAGEITPDVDVVKISGPESKVDFVNSAVISVDYADMNESFTTSSVVVLYDASGDIIEDEAIEVSKKEIKTSVEILETKEIPITAGFIGIPSSGYGATGMVICEPSSVVVAGKGATFEKLSSIQIPEDKLSVEGATENIVVETNVKNYLPSGVTLADKDYKGELTIVAVVERHDLATMEIPISNISVENLPEGYTAHIVYGEETVPVEVSGLQDELLKLNSTEIKAHIDATTLVPRIHDDDVRDENAPIYEGVNDGNVVFILPAGVVQTNTITMEVVINHSENTETED